MEITLEAVKANSGIVESLRAEWVAESKASGEQKSLADKLAATETQLTEAKKKLDEFDVKEKLAAKKAIAAKLIAEAKLPDVLVSDIFREQVENAADEASAKKIIEDRAALAGKATPGVKPVSKPQNVTEGKADFSAVNSYDAALAMLRS